MKEYRELLMDTLWKHKAKRIKKRDRNQCTACASTIDLVVHHTYYYKEFTDPWEYPDKSLITLCRKCHDDFHTWHENVIIKKPKVSLNNKKKSNKNIQRNINIYRNLLMLKIMKILHKMEL